jgi:hypothetical protein
MNHCESSNIVAKDLEQLKYFMQKKKEDLKEYIQRLTGKNLVFSQWFHPNKDQTQNRLVEILFLVKGFTLTGIKPKIDW